MKNVGRPFLFILSIDFGFSKMRRFSSDFCVQKSHLGCVNKHIPRPGSQGFFFFFLLEMPRMKMPRLLEV